MLRNLVVSAFVTFALLISSTGISNAETYRLYWEPPVTTGRTDAGIANWFDVVFDTDTNRLKWIVNFSEGGGGCLPNAFTLAVNGTGENPKGHDGELALYYYDASNFADPKLTVYGYNPVAGWGSFLDGSLEAGTQTPDLIASSILDSSFVNSFTAQTETNGTVTIGFEIDASAINNHSPLYPDADPVTNPWQGSKFGSILGMWFHPYCNYSSSYSNGAITDRDYSNYGWYDTRYQTTTLEDPVCTGPSTPITLVIGEKLNIDFSGTDPQGDDLMVNYTGLPSGAVTTPAEGGMGATPLTANVMWTPGASDGGSNYTITATFKDSHGANHSCSVPVSVLPNEAPICSFTVDNTSPACGAALIVSRLDARDSNDPDGISSPLTYSWSSDCPNNVFAPNTSSVNPTMRFTSKDSNGSPTACTVNLVVSDGIDSDSCSRNIQVADCTPACSREEVGGAINRLDGFSHRLAEVGRRVAANIAKARGKLNKRERLIRTNMAKAENEAWSVINAVPTSIQTCTGAAAAAFCTSNSHASFITTYTVSMNSVRTEVESLIKRYRKVAKRKGVAKYRRRAKRFRKKADALLSEALLVSAGLPTESSSCS